MCDLRTFLSKAESLSHNCHLFVEGLFYCGRAGADRTPVIRTFCSSVLWLSKDFCFSKTLFHNLIFLAELTAYLWGSGRVQVSSQSQVRLPVGLVSDGQAGESSAIIIHNIVGSVCRPNNLQETKHEASNS